jgi:hypothetical protein
MGRIPLALIIIYFAGGVRRKRSRADFRHPVRSEEEATRCRRSRNSDAKTTGTKNPPLPLWLRGKRRI